jgi:hypothetical protein
MSIHAAFRRQPMPQGAQQLQTITIPAPTRGLMQSENEAFMQPGGAIVHDNWVPTMRGVKLRGGYTRWCDVHALDAPAWANNTAYALNAKVYDPATGFFWNATAAHTSPATGTFAAARAATPGRWVDTNASFPRLPIISGFNYIAANNQRMYAANATKLYDVTSSTPVLVKGSQASGNYVAAQLFNQAENWMIALNDAGDFVLRTKNGIAWTVLSGVAGAAADGANNITYDPAKLPTGVAQGTGLVYAWTYRNRLYFIQRDSMNAWYLDVNFVGGVLQPIYLSGASTRGGKLLFGATWSIDAGDGTDDKCVFVTDTGEVLVFTGSNPGDVANWRQEGRYHIGAPLGMNAHIVIGGDLFIMTVDGVVPLSEAISKESGKLEQAMISRTIKPLWRDEVAAKRAYPWTIKKWDEYGAVFIATPGGTTPTTKSCLLLNNVTGAWARFTWDATCFLRMRTDMFFGTQNGIVMQADRSGYDDGVPYVATLVGGWEMFQNGSAQVVWHQARAIFTAGANEPFEPQLAATVDYGITIPPPPPAGIDPGSGEGWDEGAWDSAHWDAPSSGGPIQRSTLWVSIGASGHAHAPIVQVTVAQVSRPRVELIAIATTQERGGVNV